MRELRNLILGICAAAFALAAVCAAPLNAQVQPHVSPPSHDIAPPPSGSSGAPSSSPQSDSKSEQAPPATPQSLEKGKAIVLAAAKAAGGPALNDIKSIEVSSSGQADTPGGMMDISLKLVIVYPNLLRSNAHLTIADISQGFDGTNAWVVAPQGIIDLPPEFKGEIERAIELAGGWGLYKDVLSGSGSISLQYVDEEDLDGKKMSVVQWNAPNGPVKMFFDPSTHLLVAGHFQALTQQGPTQSDQRWSDFRAVNGIQFPYHSVIYREGQKFSETTVDSVKVNSNPDPKMFVKPAAAPEPAPGPGSPNQ